MANRDYSCSIAMSDLLFNMLLAFVALFMLAFAQMSVKKVQNNTEVKAEYLISVSWAKENDDDVDTYAEDPNGKLVCFRRREDGLMHLDRDDLGHRNDNIETPFGKVKYNENREIVTLRGVIPGEYVVNVHMYNRGQKKINDQYVVNESPLPVIVQIDQLNPFRTVVIKEVSLMKNGDEKTAIRFKIKQDEKTKKYVIEPSNLDLYKPLTNPDNTGAPTTSEEQPYSEETIEPTEANTP